MNNLKGWNQFLKKQNLLTVTLKTGHWLIAEKSAVLKAVHQAYNVFHLWVMKLISMFSTEVNSLSDVCTVIS